MKKMLFEVHTARRLESLFVPLAFTGWHKRSSSSSYRERQLMMSQYAVESDLEEMAESSRKIVAVGEESPISVSLAGDNHARDDADCIARLETGTSTTSESQLPFSKARRIALVATVATASFSNVRIASDLERQNGTFLKLHDMAGALTVVSRRFPTKLW